MDTDKRVTGAVAEGNRVVEIVDKADPIMGTVAERNGGVGDGT